MIGGYIKLYRKTLKSQVFQNEGLFKVWIWCLLKANHEGQWVSVKTGKGNTEVWVGPGQFIYGRKTAAKELKMKQPTVQKRMLKLKNMQNLITQNKNHYSLVTVASWDFYQSDNKKVSPKVSPRYQASITNKNVKNVKKDTYAQNFLTFYEAYPRHVAKKSAYRAWQSLEKSEDMETLLPILLDAIAKQEQARATAKAKGEFSPEWPYLATWLNGRRWEDEVEVKKRWDHA